MGFIKTGSAKIIKIASNIDELSRDRLVPKSFITRIAAIDEIRLNPSDFIYLRNRAISSLEVHSYNGNYDAFPDDDLKKSYATFINDPVTLDHVSGTDIGMVIDSIYVPIPSLGEDFNIDSMMGVDAAKDYFSKLFLNSRSSNLRKLEDRADNILKAAYPVDYSRDISLEDKIVHLANYIISGAYVENLWGVEKVVANSYDPRIIEALLDGEITDTSMGVYVEESECSICGNVAHDEDEYCEHVSVNKGSTFKVGSSEEDKISYEINRGLVFYEDTLIRPLEYSGASSGEGADGEAKILEVIASKCKQCSLSPYIKQGRNSMADKDKTQDEKDVAKEKDIKEEKKDKKDENVLDYGESSEELKEQKQKDIDDRKDDVEDIRDVNELVEVVMQELEEVISPGDTVTKDDQEKAMTIVDDKIKNVQDDQDKLKKEVEKLKKDVDQVVDKEPEKKEKPEEKEKPEKDEKPEKETKEKPKEKMEKDKKITVEDEEVKESAIGAAGVGGVGGEGNSKDDVEEEDVEEDVDEEIKKEKAGIVQYVSDLVSKSKQLQDIKALLRPKRADTKDTIAPLTRKEKLAKLDGAARALKNKKRAGTRRKVSRVLKGETKLTDRRKNMEKAKRTARLRRNKTTRPVVGKVNGAKNKKLVSRKATRRVERPERPVSRKKATGTERTVSRKSRVGRASKDRANKLAMLDRKSEKVSRRVARKSADTSKLKTALQERDDVLRMHVTGIVDNLIRVGMCKENKKEAEIDRLVELYNTDRDRYNQLVQVSNNIEVKSYIDNSRERAVRATRKVSNRRVKASRSRYEGKKREIVEHKATSIDMGSLGDAENDFYKD